MATRFPLTRTEFVKYLKDAPRRRFNKGRCPLEAALDAKAAYTKTDAFNTMSVGGEFYDYVVDTDSRSGELPKWASRFVEAYDNAIYYGTQFQDGSFDDKPLKKTAKTAALALGVKL